MSRQITWNRLNSTSKKILTTAGFSHRNTRLPLDLKLGYELSLNIYKLHCTDRSLVGYEPSHDELHYERKHQVITSSRKKWGYLWKKQDLIEFKTSQHDVDKTRGHRRHKKKTVSTRPRGRSSILWMKQMTNDWQAWTIGAGAKMTHSTSHVPMEENRPATIHWEHPTRLDLTVRRRTTFTVKPLWRGSVDHERLRSDKHSLPSQTLESFSVCRWCRNRGTTRIQGQGTYLFSLEDFRIEILHQVHERSTRDRRFTNLTGWGTGHEGLKS
jgi:hypothetical protein